MSDVTLPSLLSDGGLRRYLSEIKNFPILRQEEEYMLAKRWREHEDINAAHFTLGGPWYDKWPESSYDKLWLEMEEYDFSKDWS